jgi:hypothetical protein
VGALSIADFTALPLRGLWTRRAASSFPPARLIAERLRREVVERLEFLNSVGLSYLSLDRNAASSLAAKDSAFAWPRKSVPVCVECSTCSMNLPSACTSATTSG